MPEKQQQPPIQRTGRVRWFNKAKGFGFIVEDGRPEVDIFLHHSAIQVAGFRELEEGQRVLFTVEKGEKGPIARDVLPIENT